MPRSVRWTLIALALLITAPFVAPLAAQAKLPNDSLELGRKWSLWFLGGRADSLASAMAPDMLQSHGGVAGITEAQAMVAERAGLMKSVMEEKFVWRNGQRQYWRTMAMSVLPEPFLLRFVMTSDGRISGVGLGPLSEAPPVDSSGPAIKP